MSTEPTLLRDGMRFPEGSRWHAGRMVFSDMHTGDVLALDPDTGDVEVLAHLDGQPSGLGWTPDGDLLVSSMLDNRIVRFAADGTQSTHADLSSLTPWPTNEMLVTADGHAYVGGFGYDLYNEAPAEPGPVFHVSPDGSAELGAGGFTFPNGTVLVPGTRTLVVAETWGRQLTAFTLDDAGRMGDRRVWAPLWPEATADGICVDSEGGIWISSILESEFVRVVEGGEVTDRIAVPGELAVDCVLGGADGRTLFLSTSNSWQPAETATAQAGRISTVRVTVPGPTD